MELTKNEILMRINNVYSELNSSGIEWDAAFFIDKINQYYLTGTMQDGVFVLRRDGSYMYFVRRSYERAKSEALIENIYPMVSYRDVAAIAGNDIHKIFLETEFITLGILERIKKYFQIDEINSVHKIISKVRAVKSDYELYWMTESGRQHNHLFDNIIPSILKEGISEAELTGQMYSEMVRAGYQGISRFAMFQSEVAVGQLGFGENSMYPTSFDGPGGMKGMSPAIPLIGDRNRLLKKGDLVFIDIGYGVNGYHSDRTQVYMFGSNPPDYAVEAHRQCMKIQKSTSNLLKPGNIPAEIHKTIMDDIPKEFLENFMGIGSERVKFLGHGIGLQIDEYPVIAQGFSDPLKENMAIALEPKKSIPGFGIVGVEDTYIVTKNGGKCITGGESEIIVI